MFFRSAAIYQPLSDREAPGRRTKAAINRRTPKVLLGVIALWWGGAPGMALAEEPVWATGRALREHLAAPVNVLWEGNPLRSAISGLSRTQHVAVLIDRRVDPGQKLEVSLKQVPLESALKTIAEGRELGVCRLPWGLYLGPPAAAERFEAVRTALAGGIRRLPPAMQRKYRQFERLAWEDLSTPRDLVENLLAETASKSRTWMKFRTIFGRPRICHRCRWAIGCWQSPSNST